MFSMLKRVVAPPIFPGDDEKTGRAKLLNIILLTVIAFAAGYYIVAPKNPDVQLYRIITIGPFLLVMLVLRGMMFKGKVRLTGIILVGTMWLTLTFGMSLGGGYTNAAYIGYLLVVVCAALLLGKWAALFWAVISILASALVLIIYDRYQLVGAYSISEFAFWIAQSFYILETAILLTLALQNIDDALAKARRELAERIRAEEKDQRRSEMLERVIHAGQIVTESIDLNTCLIRIWKGLRDDFGFERAALFLYQYESNTMKGTYGTDKNGNMTEEFDMEFPLDEGSFFAEVMERPNGYFLTHDYDKMFNYQPDHIMYGVKHYAAVSAWKADKPVAVIVVDQLLSGEPFEPEQLEALRLFAGYVGLAIENARLNSELEKRVKDRTAQLELANEELEAFSYSVSHDLRAPLRSIGGFTSMLMGNNQSNLDADERGYLQRVSEGVDRMSRLIDDLLAFSRYIRLDLRRTEVDMNNLVQEVLNELKPQLESRQITWQISDLPSCLCDPTLMKQVWLNLLENSIKYTQLRDNPVIEVGVLSDDENIYFIRDNGVGFNMKYADKLFGVFQRLHSDEDFEGMGVGLAIVDRILRRHSGRIWVEAEEESGAAFYFVVGEAEYEL